MRGGRIVGALSALSLVACAQAVAKPVAKPAAQAAPATADDPRGTFTRGADGVGTYVSIPWGFSTRSYVLEGPQGLVAIDTQFLPSAAEEMIQLAKVVTSAQVKALLPSVHEKRMRAFYERYQPDYPREVAQPDVFGSTTTELSAGGLALKLHVMGAGCSEAHVVVEHAGGLFVGDLVASGSHSWLEIGKTDEWLKRIVELKERHAARVYPGRGPAGDATKLLDDEASYLRKAIALVAGEKPSMPVREDGLARAEQAMIAAYPTYEFPVFLKIGLPAEWERQARAATK